MLRNNNDNLTTMNRHQAPSVAHQIPIFRGWMHATTTMPAAGQMVVNVYQKHDGTLSQPIISTPIHADGSHILAGKNIYRPIVWWMALPPIPITKGGENAH